MEKAANADILRIQDFSFTYPGRDRPALSGVNLTVKEGEFIVLCGPSGCGKTTLLRQCKPALAPHGINAGAIFFGGRPLESISTHDAAARIGFVQQSPENQIVTDKVWHELAFGLESLGYDTPVIRLRVAEMASFFGIQEWFHRPVTELSGGQKQLLALASVMAMQPSLLILDEPTGQLDPIAAEEFLAAVGKINRELGVTIILTEHRLEEVFPVCSRAVVMDEGRVICEGTPGEAGEYLRSSGHGMFLSMPTPMRIWAGAEKPSPCPVTVKEGREWLSQQNIDAVTLPSRKSLRPPETGPAVELDEVWFKYGRDLPDVVKGLTFAAWPGEITALLGGNGTGKTTTLSLIAGLNKPYRGKVRIDGTEIEKIPGDKLFDHFLGVLPQNPQAVFAGKTVEEDLMEVLTESGLPKSRRREQALEMAGLCRLTELMNRHPYDLSGGEQQRAALAKVLLLQPKILLLDEPTKGLDAEFKRVFADILGKLSVEGVAVIIVSHDIEFCAEYADRCALFFDGGIVAEGVPRDFFSGNSFYTSAANRMARHVLPEAVTAEDVIEALGGRPSETPLPPELDSEEPVSGGNSDKGGDAAGGDGSATAGGDGSATTGGSDGSATTGGGSSGSAVSVGGHGSGCGADGPKPASSGKLPKRTIIAAAMILLAIPLTIYIGAFLLEDRKYYFISMLIIIETMIPFILVFEGRKPQAREMVIIAVLIAIAVAGRAAFFMLPQFKPVVALVIISGVAFGGETGFLVGAMTGFVSNMFFGQGPWTPWQMFAFGIIGFLAGILFKKGVLRRNRPALCVFGGLSTFVIYGGLMNPAMVLTSQMEPTKANLFFAYLQGIPFDLVHSLATVVFLALISRPMLDKLDRIKEKYGLVESGKMRAYSTIGGENREP